MVVIGACALYRLLRALSIYFEGALAIRALITVLSVHRNWINANFLLLVEFLDVLPYLLNRWILILKLNRNLQSELTMIFAIKRRLSWPLIEFADKIILSIPTLNMLKVKVADITGLILIILRVKLLRCLVWILDSIIWNGFIHITDSSFYMLIRYFNNFLMRNSLNRRLRINLKNLCIQTWKYLCIICAFQIEILIVVLNSMLTGVHGPTFSICIIELYVFWFDLQDLFRFSFHSLHVSVLIIIIVLKRLE